MFDSRPSFPTRQMINTITGVSSSVHSTENPRDNHVRGIPGAAIPADCSTSRATTSGIHCPETQHDDPDDDAQDHPEHDSSPASSSPGVGSAAIAVRLWRHRGRETLQHGPGAAVGVQPRSSPRPRAAMSMVRNAPPRPIAAPQPISPKNAGQICAGR